mmetsp:Transcript_133714/g.333686  ORF Transcript_133714/g.333686 Transcript_133714/m.333686 type:complete len:301 (-) Transcript_133714:260-1162(-)
MPEVHVQGLQRVVRVKDHSEELPFIHSLRPEPTAMSIWCWSAECRRDCIVAYVVPALGLAPDPVGEPTFECRDHGHVCHHYARRVVEMPELIRITNLNLWRLRDDGLLRRWWWSRFNKPVHGSLLHGWVVRDASFRHPLAIAVAEALALALRALGATGCRVAATAHLRPVGPSIGIDLPFVLEELLARLPILHWLALSHGASPSHQECLAMQLVIEEEHKLSQPYQLVRLHHLPQAASTCEVDDAPRGIGLLRKIRLRVGITGDHAEPALCEGNVILELQVVPPERCSVGQEEGVVDVAL